MTKPAVWKLGVWESFPRGPLTPKYPQAPRSSLHSTLALIKASSGACFNDRH